MKQTIKSLMMGAMMMALPFLFTSCEDILGHWEKPTPATPTVEELLTNLSSALEEGALVTITYTVDGVTYTSTFKKVGDEYVEQSTTAASRALTRAGTSVQAQLQYMPSTAVFNVLVFQDNKVVLNLDINSNDGTYAQTFGDGAELIGAEVGGKPVSITDNNDGNIKVIKGDNDLGAVGYKTGETWSDLYDKQSKNGHMVIQTDDAGGVIYSNGGETGQLYNDAGFSDPVKPTDNISKDVYVEAKTITYQEAYWNGTSVDNYSCGADEYTLVSPSRDCVTWSSGTYVVKSSVTINGDLELGGVVNLILCDGATLTVNGRVLGLGLCLLSIYGQSDNLGYFDLTNGEHVIFGLSNLTIHGGNITVNSGGTGIYDAPITVYNGKLSIESNFSAINTNGKKMTVYGGEVNAISSKEAGINLGTLTVYGGKVTAEGFPAIEGKFKAGTENVHFYERDNTTSEWGTIDITSTPPRDTSNKRYFHAEVEPSSN